MDTASWVVLVAVIGVLGFCIGRWHALKYYVQLLTIEDLVKHLHKGRRW